MELFVLNILEQTIKLSILIINLRRLGMNNLDNYLVCLEEGKIWDKTKEYAKKTGSFIKKHKGKIIAGAALAAAGAAAATNKDKIKAGYNKVSSSDAAQKIKKDVEKNYNKIKAGYNKVSSSDAAQKIKKDVEKNYNKVKDKVTNNKEYKDKLINRAPATDTRTKSYDTTMPKPKEQHSNQQQVLDQTKNIKRAVRNQNIKNAVNKTTGVVKNVAKTTKDYWSNKFK